MGALAERAVAGGAGGDARYPGLLRCGAEDRDVGGADSATGRSARARSTISGRTARTSAACGGGHRWPTIRRRAPQWETLLDVDALAKAEGANWVYKGVACLPPAQTECLLSLSNGGKDAVRVREYSIAKGGAAAGFVAGGFDIPEAKSSIEWRDKDTLLIATDWGAHGSTLTRSGYPFVIKTLKRGQALADAVELFRGEKTDVAASPLALEDGSGQALVRRGAGGDVLYVELGDLPRERRAAGTADPAEVDARRASSPTRCC